MEQYGPNGKFLGEVVDPTVEVGGPFVFDCNAVGPEFAVPFQLRIYVKCVQMRGIKKRS